MKLPKVLIFTITYSGKEYCYEQFAEGVSKINYPNARHIWIDNTEGDEYYELLKSRGHEVFKVARGNNSREALARSQNFARNIALKEDYDYMLSIESDILEIPADIVQQLIGCSRDVVGCLYPIGPKNNRKPCITMPGRGENGMLITRLIHDEEFKQMLQSPGLYSVNGCGLGCTLISRPVFEKIGFSYFPSSRAHSDAFFANDVWKNGFRLFVNTEIILLHENVPWSGVEDR